jgi:hypothetical protein
MHSCGWAARSTHERQPTPSRQPHHSSGPADVARHGIAWHCQLSMARPAAHRTRCELVQEGDLCHSTSLSATLFILLWLRDSTGHVHDCNTRVSRVCRSQLMVVRSKEA